MVNFLLRLYFTAICICGAEITDFTVNSQGAVA